MSSEEKIFEPGASKCINTSPRMMLQFVRGMPRSTRCPSEMKVERPWDVQVCLLRGRRQIYKTRTFSLSVFRLKFGNNSWVVYRVWDPQWTPLLSERLSGSTCSNRSCCSAKVTSAHFDVCCAGRSAEDCPALFSTAALNKTIFMFFGLCTQEWQHLLKRTLQAHLQTAVVYSDWIRLEILYSSPGVNLFVAAERMFTIFTIYTIQSKTIK